MTTFITACSHFDRTYESGYDLSLADFINYLYEEYRLGYISMKKLYYVAHKLEKRYPRREGHILSCYRSQTVLAPQKMADCNDYEPLAEYDRES